MTRLRAALVPVWWATVLATVFTWLTLSLGGEDPSLAGFVPGVVPWLDPAGGTGLLAHGLLLVASLQAAAPGLGSRDRAWALAAAGSVAVLCSGVCFHLVAGLAGDLAVDGSGQWEEALFANAFAFGPGLWLACCAPSWRVLLREGADAPPMTQVEWRTYGIGAAIGAFVVCAQLLGRLAA